MSTPFSERFKDPFTRAMDSKCLSWFAASVIAGLVFAGRTLETPLGELPGPAFRYAGRAFRTVFIQPWNPGAGWYVWRYQYDRDGYVCHGGNGRARWFWRTPKVSRWEWADSFTFGL